MDSKLKSFLFITALTVILCTTIVFQASGYEFSGYAGVQGQVFFREPLYPGQKKDNVSFVLQPEFYYESESGSSFTFTPFTRLDSSDPERSHFDIRELNYLWLKDGWELRIGISKVFWGVTEFVHFVDIINQTDLVEYIDGEDKLGQPMIHLSIPCDWGVVDMFVLPYFRERTFPGEKGRFRAQTVVDTDNVIYESSAEENHVDFAVRYSHTIGDWDFGIYHFNGTGREPTLLPSTDSAGNLTQIPFYPQIDQTGVDVQAVKGNWLFKLELLYRTGQGEDFIASVGGFEYSFINISSSGIDLGLIGEWAYDERGGEATQIFDNDIMFGARLAFNDSAGSELLAGFFHDLDSRSRIFSLESGRRFGDNWKATLDAFFVLDSSEEDIVHSLRDDGNIKIELSYFF